jgi:hypothetical protein
MSTSPRLTPRRSARAQLRTATPKIRLLAVTGYNRRVLKAPQENRKITSKRVASYFRAIQIISGKN